MNRVLSTSQIRHLEAEHFKLRKMPEVSVIEQVGRSLFELIKVEVAEKKVLFLIGQGNNAADGLVVARLLNFHGIDVSLCFLFSQEKSGGSAEFLRQREICQSFKLKQIEVDDLRLADFDLCLDGVFGIGCKLPLPDQVKKVFKKITAAKLPVWGIDTPSGINAENAQVDSDCLQCQKTFCVGAVKWFQLTDSVYEKSGELIAVDACFDEKLYPAGGEFLTENFKLSSKRNDNTYKNKKGHLLVVGGGQGMTGAPILSGYAALKSGAGLVTLATLDELREEVSKRSPVELMIKDVATLKDLTLYQSLVFGPGVTKDPRWNQFLETLQAFAGTVVFDAGFFDLFTEKNYSSFFKTLAGRCVLTPHVGEFDRFFGKSEKRLTLEKIHQAQEFAFKHGVSILYKSFRTLCFNSDGTIHYLCRPTANLATAGSGDVLGGVIAAHLLRGELGADKHQLAAALWAHNQAGHRISDNFGQNHQATAMDLLSVL